jgi:uncharacterized protein involved in propanediol utilization
VNAWGVGFAPGHHGEILQGVFQHAGRLRRALVTLPNPEVGSRAIFHPGTAPGVIGSEPGLAKVRRAAALAMTAFAAPGSPAVGGYVEIDSTIPRGVGMGSSTADVTATIRAIAHYHRASPTAEDIGALAVRVEQASDSTMIDDRVVLFGHRDGVVIETLGVRLPPMIVVGCVADPDRGGVDTLTLPQAAYGGTEIAWLRALRDELRLAVRTRDVARLGRVATASARLNQRRLPKPAFDFLLDLARRCGACGVQVAHSGTVAGVIFDPRRPGADAGVARCLTGLRDAGLPTTTIIGPAESELRLEAQVGREDRQPVRVELHHRHRAVLTNRREAREPVGDEHRSVAVGGHELAAQHPARRERPLDHVVQQHRPDASGHHAAGDE